MVFGDSKNDIGLFRFPYASLLLEKSIKDLEDIEKMDHIIKVFVGKDDATFENCTSPEDKHIHYLKDMFTKGTSEAFNQLQPSTNSKI